MSLWQFAACIDGFNRANAPDEASSEPMSPDEFDKLLDKHAGWIGRQVH